MTRTAGRTCTGTASSAPCGRTTGRRPSRGSLKPSTAAPGSSCSSSCCGWDWRTPSTSGRPPTGRRCPPCGGAMPAGPWPWTRTPTPRICWPFWKTPTSAGLSASRIRPCCPGIAGCWTSWSSPGIWTVLPLPPGRWTFSTPTFILPPARHRPRRRRRKNGTVPSLPSAAGQRRTCCPLSGPSATASASIW